MGRTKNDWIFFDTIETSGQNLEKGLALKYLPELEKLSNLKFNVLSETNIEQSHQIFYLHVNQEGSQKITIRRKNWIFVY